MIMYIIWQDLPIEEIKMWKLETQIVPVISGAMGVIKMGIDWHLKKIPGNIRISALQK